MAADETPAEREQIRFSIFGGAKLATPSRLRDLDTALRMLDAAHENYDADTRDRIYAATGWWKGTDDKWRVELPKLRRRNVKDIKEVEFADHDRVCEIFGIDDFYAVMLGDLVHLPNGLSSKFELNEIDVFVLDDKNFDKINPNATAATNVDIEHDPLFGGFYPHVVILLRTPNVNGGDKRELLDEKAMSSLTHELQHVVQLYESFSFGANASATSDRDYFISAGEVEARNAARRRDGSVRGLPPWETEEVPASMQKIGFSGINYDPELGWTRSGDGRLSAAAWQPRLSRPSARTTHFSLNSDNAERVAALVGAVGILRGETLTDRNLDAIRRSVRASISIPDLRREAERLADENRRVLDYVAHDKKISRLVARAGLADRMQNAIDRSRHSVGVRYLGGADLANEDNARYFKKYLASIESAQAPKKIQDGSPKSVLEWYLANMVGKKYEFDIPGIGHRVFTPKAGHIG